MQQTKISRDCADQIAVADFCMNQEYALLYRMEETMFGKEGVWYQLELSSGTLEKTAMKRKPTPCAGGTARTFVPGETGFFYYQERYPEKAFYRYDPRTKETERVCLTEKTVGSFQVDGEWLVSVPEPEVGQMEEPETFSFHNWKTGEQFDVKAACAGGKRLPVCRHERWHFEGETLFFAPHDTSWQDETGENVAGCLVCWDIKDRRLQKAAVLPAGFAVKQMRMQGEVLWIAGEQGTEYCFYALQRENGYWTLREKVRLKHDSYDQLLGVKITDRGFFWLKKEVKSLLENESTIWYYNGETEETMLLIRLSDFRALDLTFQPLGAWVYYQDAFWKTPCRTPLAMPMTKETVENPEK